MDDYAKLKLLLLDEERHKIDELETLLKKSIQENSNANAIVEKISPLLSDIFSKTIEENKSEFVAIFAPLISDMLESTIEDSSDKMAEVMSPIISLAIKNQVKNEKDDIVDALYPVIGNMISKYVSQSFKDMIDEINSKVQSTLSYETFKRKIVAKIKGVSETELLLQTSGKLNKIESVFLIHKESGILVSERSLKDHESIEPEMVASMLSAIRSFVNDWISKNSNNLELHEIEFGNYTIYLEVAGCCYLAVVLSGTSNRTLQDKITAVLEHLVKKHSDAILNFEGDSSKLDLVKINEKLDSLLENDTPVIEEPKSKKSYAAIWIFVLLSIASITMFSYVNYTNNTLKENIEKEILQNPYLNLYSIEIDVSYDKVVVHTRLPYATLHQKLLDIINPQLNDRILDDQVVLTHLPLTREQIKYSIDNALQSMNITEGNRLNYIFNDNKLILNGIIQDKKSYEIFLNHISSLEGINQIISDVEFNFTKQDLKLYYEVAKSELTQEKKELLNLWLKSAKAKQLLELYSDLSLLVMGFSDSKGSLKHNVNYSQKRAKNVYNYLIKKGIDVKRIRFVASPIPSQEMISKDENEGRLVEIKWMKNDN